MSSRAWGLFAVNDVRMFGLCLCRVWRNSKEPSKIRLITWYHELVQVHSKASEKLDALFLWTATNNEAALGKLRRGGQNSGCAESRIGCTIHSDLAPYDGSQCHCPGRNIKTVPGLLQSLDVTGSGLVIVYHHSALNIS
jgi:hypothetical protein